MAAKKKAPKKKVTGRSRITKKTTKKSPSAGRGFV